MSSRSFEENLYLAKSTMSIQQQLKLLQKLQKANIKVNRDELVRYIMYSPLIDKHDTHGEIADQTHFDDDLVDMHFETGSYINSSESEGDIENTEIDEHGEGGSEILSSSSVIGGDTPDIDEHGEDGTEIASPIHIDGSDVDEHGEDGSGIDAPIHIGNDLEIDRHSDFTLRNTIAPQLPVHPLTYDYSQATGIELISDASLRYPGGGGARTGGAGVILIDDPRPGRHGIYPDALAIIGKIYIPATYPDFRWLLGVAPFYDLGINSNGTLRWRVRTNNHNATLTQPYTAGTWHSFVCGYTLDNDRSYFAIDGSAPVADGDLTGSKLVNPNNRLALFGFDFAGRRAPVGTAFAHLQFIDGTSILNAWVNAAKDDDIVDYVSENLEPMTGFDFTTSIQPTPLQTVGRFIVGAN